MCKRKVIEFDVKYYVDGYTSNKVIDYLDGTIPYQKGIDVYQGQQLSEFLKKQEVFSFKFFADVVNAVNFVLIVLSYFYCPIFANSKDSNSVSFEFSCCLL